MLRKTLRFIIFAIPLLGYGQQKERPLPPNINQPSINLFAPFISGNGKVLIYLSDYADDGHHTMYFSTREGFEWEDGKEVNKLVNRPALNFRGGYALDYTGDKLYFTSRKSGLGGFDIWESERNGNDWKAPSNLGSPLNSRENEASPVVTPDGERMYFMRCGEMSPYGGAKDCRIMYSDLRNGRWSEPQPLPDNINTGNSQTPRIMGDGETLIFSSDRFGGKGGLDLFYTRYDGTSWSDPVALDFLNTDRDDSFISVPAKGRYAYVSKKGPRDYELVEILIPGEFQPEKVMRITGNVETEIPARLLIFDVKERSRLWNEEVSDGGTFSMVLKEGGTYDISVTPSGPGYHYFGRVLELEEIGRLDRQNLKVKLRPALAGDTVSSIVHFETYKIPDHYVFEMRRLAQFIKDNPSRDIELQIHQPFYREDSLSTADLTEIRVDTVFHPPADTLIHDPLAIEGHQIIWTEDSVNVAFTSGDTLRFPKEWFKTRKVYHNDRTQKQAVELVEFLQSRGVDSTLYTIVPVVRHAVQNPDDPDSKGTEENKAFNEKLIAIIRE